MTNEQKQLHIEDTYEYYKNNNDESDKIIDILFFTEKIIWSCPCLEYQTCGECFKYVKFYDINVDCSSTYKRDNNGYSIDPSLCDECLKVCNNSENYCKLPTNKEQIDKIVLNYYYDRKFL